MERLEEKKKLRQFTDFFIMDSVWKREKRKIQFQCDHV